MFSLKTIIVLAVIILIFHVSAIINHLYWYMPWLDMPVHALSGAWVAMLYFYLYPQNKSVLNCLSFVALFGVFWEFFEFTLNHLSFLRKFGTFQGNLSDTMADLFFGLVGGLIFVLLDKIFRKNRIKI